MNKIVILLGAVFACGASGVAFAHDGESHEVYAAGEPGNPREPYRIINVTMNESDGAMIYTPSQIDVVKGQQVKFIVTNAGVLKHEFFLDSAERNAQHKMAMQSSPDMKHDDPNAKSIDAGKTLEILWKFSKPGTFEFACLIPGHYEAGMHGAVNVK